MTANTVLVLDDEKNIRTILKAMLNAEGYEVEVASKVSVAKDLIRAHPVEVVLTDLKLQREDGLSLLKWMKENHLPAPVIILTAHGSIDSAVDAMKQGAFDYLSKPFERTELVSVINKAILTYRFQNHHALKSIDLNSFPLIGRSEKMLKVYGLVDKVGPTDATVLITGESGTGKELIAQAIFEKSSRANRPFIKINCAAIPPTLMESELFGYEKGAFTGAVNSKPGRFELADTGTLFLDEVGEMSTEMQVKLLRVLQNREFERVGGVRTIKVDVRLIAATNKNLESEVKDGRFRGDLFYRLNVVPISLPPLRERPDDIPVLAGYFVKKFCEQMKKNQAVLDPECLLLLSQFPWPGNIRQLENLIERIIVMLEGNVILPDDLPGEILDYEEEMFERSAFSLKEQVREVTRRIEMKAIEEALEETNSNVTQAARKLNISRKGLQLKMKELGLR